MVRLRLISMLTTMVLVLLMPTAVQAADPGSGWIYFNPHVPFTVTNGTETLLQGTKASDGSCRGGLTLRHEMGQPAVVAIEVGANPSTCQQLIEVGSAPAPSGLSPMASGWRSGYFVTTWVDPLDLQLASVQDSMTWTYDGTYVDSVSSYSETLNEDQFTGWYVQSDSGAVLSWAPHQYSATVYSNVTFQNYKFCGGTTIHFQPNSFTAYGAPRDAGYVDTWATGCDTNLIYYYSYLW